MKNYTIILLLFFVSISANSQSIFNDFSDSSDEDLPSYSLITERIKNISLSRRIYLITNSQESFSQGDFVTILIDEKPIARGLIAKLNSGVAALKITKIYSAPLYNGLRANLTIQVIRGDDSFYRKKKASKDEGVSITDEDDLFDDTTILEEDLFSDERNKNEAIKNDNVVSFGFGLVDGFNESGDEAKNNQLNATYAYQIESNIWLELLYGEHLIKDYPAATIDTKVTNLTVRAKYAVKGPLYTIFMPYIGFQLLSASSPGAGDTSDATEAQEELAKVEAIKDKGLVFGVTILKRLVPGWFIRAELGTDMLAFGLALEF